MAIGVLGILVLLLFSSISANEKYDIYTKLLFISVEKAVHADYTVILHARKPIHVSKSFGIRDMFGSKKIADIGISRALEQK